METHQKDIEEKDPFGQNSRNEADEKSFLKALLAERALKNQDSDHMTCEVETVETTDIDKSDFDKKIHRKIS